MVRLVWGAAGTVIAVVLVIVALVLSEGWDNYASRLVVQAATVSAPLDAPEPTIPPAIATHTPLPTASPTATSTPTSTGTATASPTITVSPTPTLSPTPLPARVKVPILMYHYIRVNPDANDIAGFGLSVTPQNFEAQVQYLATHGYHTISFEQLVAYFKEGRPLPPNPIILTFDDGYRDFYIAAYPVLKKYGMGATSFVITDWVGRPVYLTSDQILEMAADGSIEFGSHTAKHVDMRTVGEAEARTEVDASKRALETLTGKPVVSFCYPSGFYSASAVSLIKKAGYQAAVTTQHGMMHTDSELFLLTRVRVSGSTTLSELIRQIGPP